MDIARYLENERTHNEYIVYFIKPGFNNCKYLHLCTPIFVDIHYHHELSCQKTVSTTQNPDHYQRHMI